MKKLATLCLIGLLFAACTPVEPQEEAIDKTALTEEIKTLMKNYGEAWSMDEDTIMKFYLNSEDFVFYSGNKFYGYEGMQSLVKEMFAPGIKYEGFPYHDIRVGILSKESAFFTSHLDYMMTDTNEVVNRIGGGVTYILVKNDDHWRIIHGIADHYVVEK